MQKENNVFIIYIFIHKVKIGDEMKKYQKISLWFSILTALNYAAETLLDIRLLSHITQKNRITILLYAFSIGLCAFINMFLDQKDL